MGGEAREGPNETEEIPPGIYTISGGVPQRGGGLIDRMRLRSNDRDPDLQVSEFGVITCAIGEHHLVRSCFRNHHRHAKILSHNQSGHGLSSSGHTTDRVKMAYRS